MTWRPERYRIGKPYVEEYFKHFPISEPVEDQDDRKVLCSMLVETLHPAVDVPVLCFYFSFAFEDSTVGTDAGRRFNLHASSLFSGNKRFRNM